MNLLPVSVMPLVFRPFAFKITNTDTITWEGKTTYPIYYTHNDQRLDAGVLCLYKNSIMYPVARFSIVDTELQIYEETDEIWVDPYLYTQICNAARANPGFSKLNVMTLIDTIANTYITNVDTKCVYLLGSQQQCAELAYKALLDTNDAIQYSNVPNDVYKHLLSDIQRYPIASSNDKTTILDHLALVNKIPFGVTRPICVDELSNGLNTSHHAMDDTKKALNGFFSLYAENLHLPKCLCLVGEPGTGKTSLLQSAAQHCDLPSLVLPLAGINDIAILNGFTRSYNKAEPGRIVKALALHQQMNLLIILDEIDKADPDIWNLLIHLLDGSANNFVDSYLGFPVDLTNCLFIATANSTSGLPAPLADRLLIHQVHRYTSDEKLDIIETKLIPKFNKLFNLNIQISSDCLIQLGNLQSIRAIENAFYIALITTGQEINSLPSKTRSFGF